MNNANCSANGHQRLLNAAVHAAKVERQVTETFDKVIQNSSHRERLITLFRLWAPLYDPYWEITGHARATRRVLRQLDGIGVFNGRGLEPGCGTGLVPFELGRFREEKALDDLKSSFRSLRVSPLVETVRKLDDETSKGVRDITDECIAQKHTVDLLIDYPSLKLDAEFSENLRLRVDRLLVDDFQAIILEKFFDELGLRDIEQYKKLSRAIKKGTSWNEILACEQISYLARVYLRNAVLVRNIRQNIKQSSPHMMAFTDAFNSAFKSQSEIIGLDLSPEMLSVAREKCRKIYGGIVDSGEMFVEGDATNLPPSIYNQHFDYVVLSQIIHLLPDDEKQKLIEEISNILQARSKLIVID